MSALLLLVLTAAPTQADWALAERLGASGSTWSVDREKLAAHPVDPGAAAALVARLTDDCLQAAEKCRDPLAPRSDPHEGTLEALINVLGEIGRHADLPLLDRLDARGLYVAGRAAERILAREWEATLPSLRPRCRPPSTAEVARQAAALSDFFRVDGRAETARPLTALERDDLAYFLASVDASTPAVGTSAAASSWTQRAAPDVALDALNDQLAAAKLSGDPAKIEKLARAYLERLGYPGAITKGDQFGWHGARFSYVMRDLAHALERTGGFAEAASLQRSANPSGGMCGTGASSRWASQVEATIRTTERAGGCATAERLLEISDEPVYGTAELVRRGFDLKRLYRGALVTMSREDPKLLDRALAKLDATSAALARARLARMGPEAWEHRVHALEGWIAESSAAELEPAVSLFEQSTPEGAQRGLEAFGARLRRPDDDPCGELRSFGSTISSEWSRRVEPISERCETHLDAEQESALARRLSKLEAYDAGPVKLGLARALAELASKDGAATLERLRATKCAEDDTYTCWELSRIGTEGAERIARAVPFGPKPK